MEAGFGEKVEGVNALSRLITYAPALPSDAATILLGESYETTYGIHQHTPASDPLESFLLHPLEDVSRNSRLYEHVRKFFRADVSKHSGLSMNDYFDLPRDIAEIVIEESEKKQKADAVIGTNFEEQMRRMGLTRGAKP